MKRPLNYCVMAIAIAMITSSCSHVYYAPNGQNVPLFKEKGEVQIGAGSAGSGEAGGANIQAAFSPTNHLGLALNTYFASGKNDDNGASGHGYIVEGGVGYFTPIQEHFVFETYGGFGGGNVINNYAGGGASEAKFIRPYIQPAFGFTSNYVDVAIASRFAFNHFTSVTSSGAALDSTNSAQFDRVQTNPSMLIWEPGITLRGGWKYIKVQFQYVWSVPFSDRGYNRDNHNISLGLLFHIAPRYSKK